MINQLLYIFSLRQNYGYDILDQNLVEENIQLIIVRQASCELEVRMNKNHKIIKFARKQIQISEPVNQKKKALSPRSPRLYQPQEKLRSNSKISKRIEHGDNKFRMQNNIFMPQKMEKEQQNMAKQETIVKSNQNVILLDKNLIKLIIPDEFQKYKFIEKIENRLISCLERKKPHIPIKKLISNEVQSQVIGEKERKLISKTDHNIEKYEIEAQSMKMLSNMKEGIHVQKKKQMKKLQKINNQPKYIKIPKLMHKLQEISEESSFFFNQNIKPKYENPSKFIFDGKSLDNYSSVQELSNNYVIKQGPFPKQNYQGSHNLPLVFDPYQDKQSYFYTQPEQQHFYRQNPFQKKLLPEKTHQKNVIFDIKNIKIPKIEQSPNNQVYYRRRSTQNFMYPIAQEQISRFFSDD